MQNISPYVMPIEIGKGSSFCRVKVQPAQTNHFLRSSLERVTNPVFDCTALMLFAYYAPSSDLNWPDRTLNCNYIALPLRRRSSISVT